MYFRMRAASSAIRRSDRCSRNPSLRGTKRSNRIVNTPNQTRIPLPRNGSRPRQLAEHRCDPHRRLPRCRHLLEMRLCTRSLANNRYRQGTDFCRGPLGIARSLGNQNRACMFVWFRRAIRSHPNAPHRRQRTLAPACNLAIRSIRGGIFQPHK